MQSVPLSVLKAGRVLGQRREAHASVCEESSRGPLEATGRGAGHKISITGGALTGQRAQSNQASARCTAQCVRLHSSHR